MKKWSRLTALMLAFVIMFSTVSGALAAVEVDYEALMQWIQSVKDAHGLGGVIKLDRGGEVVYVPDSFVPNEDWPLYTVVDSVKLSSYAVTDAPRLDVMLDQYGKVDLAAPAEGTWQVYLEATNTWVDVKNETGSTFALTFAKVQSLLTENLVAKLRCLMGNTVTQTVYVTVQPYVASASAEEQPSVMSYASRAVAAAETPNTNNVTLSITYQMPDGSVAATPWTASIQNGTDLQQTIINPAIIGYKATLKSLPQTGVTFNEPKPDAADSAAQRGSVVLELTKITEDLNVIIEYKPINVVYTVYHYQQNVDNDAYTLVDTEQLKGLTKSVIPEVAVGAEGTISQKGPYSGFYALLYDKPEIAADGTTLVEVYYDRNYYLMNFVIGDGAYGTEPIYARYGAEIGSIMQPTRSGYTFLGWSLDGQTIITDMPTTMPAGNVTYTALWKAVDTATVTIVFWGENADDEEYSHIQSTDIYLKPGTSFTYSENGSIICGQEAHTHGAACGYACKYNYEHVHTIQDGCYQLICTESTHNHVNDNCTLDCKHTHKLDCYTASRGSLIEVTRPNENLTHLANGIYRYRTGFIITQSHYYLNIGDKWYRSNSGDTNSISLSCKHSHGDECFTCGQQQSAHVHTIENGCYKLICEIVQHTHSDDCGYNCGKNAHTHTSACYVSGAGLDSNLWKFVRSETKIVAADGSTVVDVYFDRVEKTLTYNYNYDWGYKTTKTITAKWGQDISAQYEAIAEDADSTFWSANYNGDGPWTNYFGIMPEKSATYYNRGTSGSNGTMKYYGESLEGDYVEMFSVGGVGGYSVTDEDHYEFEGFTYHHGTSNNSSCSGASFYYTRNSYNLIFNDGYNDVRTDSVKYQAPLSTYEEYVPAPPKDENGNDIYEPGTVVFDGWYLNPECSGEEYILGNHTMPADNLLLYANWKPLDRKVEFYLDEQAYEKGEKLATHKDVTVPHGSKVDPKPADPANGNYKFVGWFYMEDGVEKAFDFANMPVTKNMQVYGKWSSNVLKEYSVYFKAMIKDPETGEEKEVEIADPIKGSTQAGMTKTFDAKGDSDLYPDYQDGYFPLVTSHSIKLDINDDSKNTYTFWYVQKEAVPYKVYYLIVNEDGSFSPAIKNEDGTEYIKEVNDNHKAVVTETFEVVPGYMPDAYQKRLVVTVDENGNPNEEENVIIFYYTEDNDHAYYKVTHFTENLKKDINGNTTWTEYGTPSQIIGDINGYYTAKSIEISGFTYKNIEYVVDGEVLDENELVDGKAKLTEAGLEINLYYVRNSYPYEIRYLKQGTGMELHAPEKDTAPYDQVISANAVAIENYDALDPIAQTLTIRIEEGTEATVNIITFYYKEKEVAINYVPVFDRDNDGDYDVMSESERQTIGDVDRDTESLPIISGGALGSTASLAVPSSSTYKFEGWYSDPECKPEDLVSTDPRYVPTREEGALWEAATYYAKFDYNLTTLTIKKSCHQDIDDGQSFLFKVEGYGLPEGGLLIAINGDGSETISGLTVGQSYTVTEVENWSWRYTAEPKSITLTSTPSENKVEMVNTRDQIYWLSGDCYEENVFGEPSGN